MKLGAQFLCEDFDDCMAAVVAAERAGYDLVWFIDSHILWEDPYVYMAHTLQRTERVLVGTAVSNPITRHWTVTASVNATLAKQHPGRVILGLGRGDSAVRAMGVKPVTTKTMAESIGVMRELMQGKTVRMNDTDVHFRWLEEGPGVPIAVSATGPKTLRMAGALADIVMIYVGVHPDSVRWATAQVRAGAEEAGRDPDEVRISVLCGMEVSDDVRAARDAVRWAAAACANHIADVAKNVPDHGMPAVMTRLIEARNQHYDYYAGHLDSSADHTAYLTDELIDDFAIAGPAEHCLAKLEALADLGVWEVSPAYFNGRIPQLELVGREIIPRLAARA